MNMNDAEKFGARELEQQQFFTGDVVKALDWDNATLQNVLMRGWIDIPNPGIGGRRLFSAETVLVLAYAKELMSYGLGPNQATRLTKRSISTRYLDGQLREYLPNPTGQETLALLPNLKPEDEISGSSREFCANGIVDTTDWYNRHSGIVLRVGAIAKQVLERLENILKERKS